MAITVYIFLSLYLSVWAISDQRLCADSKCEVAISKAEVQIPYQPSENEKIKLERGQIVTVYSKGAGKDKSLWEVEVDGRRGYAPKAMLKETRTFHKKLEYVVSTKIEGSSVTNGHDNNTPEENVLNVPSISNSFEVVDGTTIYANPTGDVLETQPIKTFAMDMQQTDEIQSSKTIDATSISKNKLDEPNSSLIIPQPTTSSPPLYSASGSENVKDAQVDEIYEDAKRTTLDGQTTENPEKEEKKIIEGDSESLLSNEDVGLNNLDNSKKFNEGNEVIEDDNIKNSNDEIESEEEIEEEGDEEDEEDEEEGDEDTEGIETDVKEAGGGENQKRGQTYDDKKNAVHNNSSDEAGTVGMELNEPNSSELGIIDSTELEKKSVETTIKDERLKKQHHDQHGETPSTSKENENVEVTAETKETSDLHINVSTHEFIGNGSEESIERTESDTVTPGANIVMKDGKADIENEELKDNLKTVQEDFAEESGEKGSLEHGSVSVISENIVNIDTSSENANAVSTEEPQKEVTEGKEGTVSNFFQSFGKWSEILQEDSSKETEDISIHKEDVSMSESSKDSDVPDITDNESTEQTPVDSSFEDIPDQFVTEEYQHVTQQENSIEPSNAHGSMESSHSGEQDSGDFSQNMHEDYNSNLEETDQTKISPEVQGTSDMQSSECVLESEDQPEQQSSVKDAESGWLASLTERASLDSEFLTVKEMQKNSFDTLLYLMVTAITVLVFSLGYYYIEKQRRDGSLLAKINKLEKALMISSQEKFDLKDELESLSAHPTSPVSEETSNALTDELEEYKNARAELEEQVAALEKELEAATEAGLELNRMMSELLSAQHGSDTLMKSVEHLQKQLDSQQSTISTMNACLTAKNLENENLQSELNIATERVQNLEEQLSKVTESLTNVQKEKSEIEHDFQTKNQSIESQLVEALESKSADSQRLCRELDALQDVLDETRKTLGAREGEVSVLRECLSHAECLSSGGESNISLEDLLDVGHLRAKIDTVSKERVELQEKLQGEEDARKLLEDHMKIVSEEVSTLRTKYEEADRGKMEAQTRLEVLSNYFKEKETQLQKELGLQEAMYIQKEGDALSTFEQIKAFQEEIENYKAQNEILKREIIDQERSMKSQISILEKKAHENWVAARHAERRLEESKQEATQLRNRLTLSGRRIVGTIPGPDVGKPPERGTLDLERNGEMSSSPAHMSETQELPSSPLHFGLPASPPLLPPGGQPLPPGPFPGIPLFLPPGGPGMPFPMPPPPGGLFPDDLRPPPLGRMSSPPPEPHGSFSPFDHSPPMSPHSRPYRSPIHYDDSPRYRRHSPPSSGTPSFSGPFSPGKWDDRSEPPRSSFRPLHRDSPREPKGSGLSSGHSSESLDKGSRHSRV